MTDQERDPSDAPTTVLVEVTDTLSIGYTTGIQRVVREVVRGLRGPAGAGLRIVPILKPSVQGDYRTLTPEEDQRLRDHPPGGRAGRRADSFGPLSPVVRVVGDLRIVIWTRVTLGKIRRRRREYHPLNAALAIGTPERGSIFLDLEGSWHDPEPRPELLPRLHSEGVASVVFVHDVMPVSHPEWFDPRHISVFESWLDAHLRWSSRFLCNSECTARDLRAAAVDHGHVTSGGDLDVVVVPLGADYDSGDEGASAGADGAHAEVVPVELPPAVGRFILVVGTLEPRKNQRVVLDAFDRLSADHPDLAVVLVGKEGWMVDDLVARIRSHPEFERRLLWFGGIDDAELSWLYENALLSIAPSKYEGLGVPVLEALAHGCPTISSTGGAQPEAGAGATELFDPEDVDALTALVRAHLDDAEHHARTVERAQQYTPPSWTDAARVVAEALLGVELVDRGRDGANG